MVSRRRLVWASTLLVGLGVTVLLAQELPFVGRYEDVRFISQTKPVTDKLVFARLIYNGRIRGYYKNWYTDYPKADRQLIMGIKRLTNLEIEEHEVAVPIIDPDLFKYPFLYTSEPGQMVLSDQDAAILREYLARGGFWVLDDFWGSFEWNNLENQMRKILPGSEIKDIPPDHPIFHVFFDVNKVMQVPSLAYVFNGGITWEQDGFEGKCKGVFDDEGRLLVVINHNTDLGDAYEWMDDPKYPYQFSSYAYRVAINFMLYALSH